MRRSLALVFVSLASGCAATGEGAITSVPDAAVVEDASQDVAPDVPACTLGTAEHCGRCGVSCGTTDKATLRACTNDTAAGTCTFACRAEFYDVDKNPANGCEAEDPTVHDSANTAVVYTLPDVVNDPQLKSNPLNIIGYVYGDDASHETAPMQRKQGREDWYQITVVGAGSGSGMGACLGITNFPTDTTFEVCVSDNGGSTFPTAGCKTVKGGATSVCVAPTGNTNAGVYYVRVRKIDGTNTTNGYALFMKH